MFMTTLISVFLQLNCLTTDKRDNGDLKRIRRQSDKIVRRNRRSREHSIVTTEQDKSDTSGVGIVTNSNSCEPTGEKSPAEVGIQNRIFDPAAGDAQHMKTMATDVSLTKRGAKGHISQIRPLKNYATSYFKTPAKPVCTITTVIESAPSECGSHDDEVIDIDLLSTTCGSSVCSGRSSPDSGFGDEFSHQRKPWAVTQRKKRFSEAEKRLERSKTSSAKSKTLWVVREETAIAKHIVTVRTKRGRSAENVDRVAAKIVAHSRNKRITT